MKELFKKANKERIELDRHKSNLRNYLIESEYFDTKKEIDFKLIMSSIVFSVFLIVVTVLVLTPNNPKSLEEGDSYVAITPMQKTFTTNTVGVSSDIDEVVSAESFSEESENILRVDEDLGLYERLLKNDNIKIIGQTTWDNQEVYALELEEDNIIMIYYFNKEKNLLLGTEVINNNK